MTKVTVGLTDPYPIEFLPQAEAVLDYFIDGPAFDTMAQLHGVELPGTEDRDARMVAIAQMSDDFWDLRGKQGGVERQNVDYAKIGWSDMPGLSEIQTPDSEAWRTVTKAANQAQMAGDILPPDGQHGYGARYALGAFATSQLPRIQAMVGHPLTTLKPGLEFGRKLVHPALQDQTGIVIGLGTHRPLNERAGESAIAAHYAPYAKTESGLVLAGFKREFAGRFHERTYDLPDVGYEYVAGDTPRFTELSIDKGALTAYALHAPEPIKTELGRAQTPHTYAMMAAFLKDIIQLMPGDSLLGVSNSIYQFQNVAAVNAFGRLGLQSDFAGFGDGITGIREPAQFLPEFRSLELQLRYLYQAVKAAKATA